MLLVKVNVLLILNLSFLHLMTTAKHGMEINVYNARIEPISILRAFANFLVIIAIPGILKLAFVLLVILVLYFPKEFVN